MNWQTESILFLVSATTLGVFFYVKPSPALVVNFASEIIGLFLVGVCATALIYYQIVYPIRRRLALKRQKENEETLPSETTISEQKNQRQRVQEEFVTSALAYQKLQQDRREAALKKKEAEFYRFHNSAYRTAGQVLKADSTSDHRLSSDINRDAADRRHIDLQSVATSSSASSMTKNQNKKKIVQTKVTLPEEPLEGASGSVAILFRTPDNRIHKRRFLTSETVKTLLDYMKSIGFSPRLYQLMMPYPLTAISDEPSTTIEQLGITKQSLLIISYKDD